jgi:lipopolysaccharide export system permease protein
MKLIDRYLLGRIAPPFVGTMVVVICVLSLENMARLLDALGHVGSPLALLGRQMLSLLPEYVGIGLLVSLFVAVAVAVRDASLAGEWHMLAAARISPLRIMLIPLALALACAATQLAVRFYFQPIGEYRLATLGSDIRQGAYGMGGPIREFVRLGRGSALTTDGVDPRSGHLSGVFIYTRALLMTARTAEGSYDGGGNLRLALNDGTLMVRDDKVPFRKIAFKRIEVNLPVDERAGGNHSPQNLLDRLTLAPLLRNIAQEREAGRPDKVALSAFASRLSYALFALLIPFMAMALGAVPLRGRTALGLIAGLGLITAFIRGVAFVEAHFVRNPLPAFALYFAGCTVLVLALWRMEQVSGPGACERWLLKWTARPILTTARYIRFKGTMLKPAWSL